MPLIYRNHGFVERRLSHGPGEDRFVGPGVCGRTEDADLEQRVHDGRIRPSEVLRSDGAAGWLPIDKPRPATDRMVDRELAAEQRRAAREQAKVQR